MTALSFRDYQSSAQRVLQGPMAQPVASAVDVFTARAEAGFLMGTLGAPLARLRAVDRIVEAIPGYDTLAQQVQAEIAATIPAPAKGVRPRAVPGLTSPEVAEAVRQRYLRDAPLPARQNVPPALPELEKQIAREAEIRANVITENAGTLGEIAGFAGDFASGALSLETLATIMLTPARVIGAVGVRAVGIVAGREAAIGAAVEAPAQVYIQGRREELGFDSGFWQGAMNAAVVGGLSGVLGGAIRGVVEWRNALRAGRTTPGSAARRAFDSLSPEAQRNVENVGWDVRAVAAVVTREFEANPRFRARLRPEEREAVERVIQLRENYLPFQPRSRAEVENLERAITDLGASLELGLPFRPETLREVGPMSPVPAPRAAFRAPQALLEHAPEEVKAAVRALEAAPAPAVRAPVDTAGLRFSKGQREQFERLLQEEGRTAADARAVIDAGEARLGARGQITKQTMSELRDAFVRLPRDLPPVARPDRTTPPPRTVADLQGRPAELPPLDATAARISDQELDAIRRMTDAQRADEAEASLRAREAEPAAQAVVRDIDTLKAIEAAVEGCRFG